MKTETNWDSNDIAKLDIYKNNHIIEHLEAITPKTKDNIKIVFDELCREYINVCNHFGWLEDEEIE